MAKYSEVNQAVTRLRAQAMGMLDLADFLEAEGVKLQEVPYVSSVRSFDCYLTENDTSFNSKTEKWETELDEEKTKRNIRRFLDTCGTVEKKYTGELLTITKEITDCVQLRGFVQRTVVCKPTKIEKRWVAPQEGFWTEDVKEWDCGDTPSLLALVKEDD